jgi:hypothetical protein
LKEGEARKAGRIMQAPPPPPKVIKCANCGTENPGENSVCSNCGAALPRVQAAQPAVFRTSSSVGQPATKKPTNWKLIGGILGALALCCIVGVYLFLFPSSAIEATVTDVHWETSVAVQEIQPVRYTDERGNPPSGAYNESCYTESEDVCEQRTVDQGNGFSEIVEECHTETTQYCSYTLDEWTTVQTYPRKGNDLRPLYDSPNITSDQQIGDKRAEYTVVFSTEDGTETYTPESISEFQQYAIGSTWTLKMNALGGVVGVEP